MNQKRVTALSLLMACALIAVLSGCSVGMAPEGPNEAQLKEKFNSLDVDKQIELIQHSPMPQAEKEKKIAELRAKGGSTTAPTTNSEVAPPQSGR